MQTLLPFPNAELPQPLIAGCDEVGRGPWAGPVVAAAVILDPCRIPVGLDDSKVLSAKRRTQLDMLIRDSALAVSIGQAGVEEIDQINILQATMLAMRRAVAGLAMQPVLVLVDGNRAPQLPMACETIIGGDATRPEISAASIVAKVFRDALMLKLADQYPVYGFERHFGYGTMQHRQALLEHGPCAVHRRSFAPIRKLIQP